MEHVCNGIEILYRVRVWISDFNCNGGRLDEVMLYASRFSRLDHNQVVSLNVRSVGSVGQNEGKERRERASMS